MKATFIMLPLTLRSLLSSSSKVLFENIKRNDKLEVEYNADTIKVFEKLANKSYEKFKNININSDDTMMYFLCNTTEGKNNYISKIYSFSTDFFQTILDTIKTEYVIISFPSVTMLPFLKFLLENGKIVLAGGSYTNIHSLKELRQYMVDIGTPDKQLEKLMFHKGYLDFDTDLCEIFNSRKDYVSKVPKFIDNIWRCTDDFYNIKYKESIKNKIPLQKPMRISVLLNDNCFHKKCLFCTWKFLTNNNYIENFSVDELFEQTLIMSEIYNLKSVVIVDSYFLHTPKIKEYCIKLRENGFSIAIITGVLAFKDLKKIAFFNTCIDSMTIGLDSCVDEVLNIVNKPHRYNDIQVMIHNMSNYLNKKIEVRFSMMFDLPTRTNEDVFTNWRHLNELVDTLISNGMNIRINNYFLANFPKQTLITDTKYYREVKNYEFMNYRAGLSAVFNAVDKQANLNHDDLNKIIKPFVKINEDGNIIKSEFNYITSDTIKNIYRWG